MITYYDFEKVDIRVGKILEVQEYCRHRLGTYYKELITILGELREATKRAFHADWFNYAFLGNGTRHLHGHFVPRYSSPRIFEEITFVDKLWGHNYRTDHDFVTPPEVLEAVRIKLEEELS